MMERVSNDLKALLKDLVMIESPSGDREGIRKVLLRLAEAVPKGSANIRFYETPRGPILSVERGSNGALMLGHADTVWEHGTLETMPYREEGGVVYGPGCLDMKAGLVLAVAAIEKLEPSVPFRLLVTPDEEIGSSASRELIEHQAKQSTVVLVLEPAGPEGSLIIGRSGVGDFRLVIKGIEGHAGSEPEKGASAIRELAQQILWLEGLDNRLLGTTVNVGVVEGGTRTNVVAARAEAFIDVRAQTRYEMERIKKTLAHPPRFDHRVSVEYQGSFNRPAMEPMGQSQEWFQRAAEAWKKITGLDLGGVRVGAASDGNVTASICPTLDGLGPVGQGAHARHEHIYWDSVEPRIELLGYLLEEAAQGGN